MRVLLVEPAYRNKYPPLGLMKIAAFHRERGDDIRFVKGCEKNIAAQDICDNALQFLLVGNYKDHKIL